MLEIFKLIRLRTIAFTAFMMYAMRYLVVRPILDKEGFALQMLDGDFSLLVIAVCCLVSAAYVINDYFDTKADRISGSRSVIVGKTITRRGAIVLHTLLNVVAVGIAFHLACNAHHWEIVFLFIGISVLLWYYSSRFKKRYIWGNVIVAGLAALIPLSVITFEIPLLCQAYSDVVIKTNTSFTYVFYWTFCFSFFIFLNMLIYEINKDIYSINGDQAEGIETLPVRLGIGKTRQIIFGLVMICILFLLALYLLEFMSSIVILLYFVIALLVPYTIYTYSVMTSDHMKFQLRMIRLILVLCVTFSLLLRYFFNSQS